MLKLAHRLTQLLCHFRILAELATRLTVGWVFAHSGYGKLTHLDKVIGFFSSLHIPHPELQAPFVAGMELFCGICVLVGFATRFVSFPLIVIMLVALRTAKWDDIHDPSSLFAMQEYLLIVLLTWLIANGAGRLSVDALVGKRIR